MGQNVSAEATPGGGGNPTASLIRQLSRTPSEAPQPPRTFEDLIREEERWLAERVGDPEPTAAPIIRANDDEPWVAWTPKDRFGLALSGGGIRSATFNLGLLQALSRRVPVANSPQQEELSVLELVDYVATVSGGGYIGGFWSRWLHEAATSGEKDSTVGWALLRERLRHFQASGAAKASPAGYGARLKAALQYTPSKVPSPSRLKDPKYPVFPQVARDGGRLCNAESPAIRHLRERSRFLMPRVGVFSYQTWGGLVALFGAMLPSLVIAGASLFIAWCAWLSVVFVVYSSPLTGALALAGTAALIFAQSELRFRSCEENRDESLGAYVFGAILCSAVVGIVWYALLSRCGLTQPAAFCPAKASLVGSLLDTAGPVPYSSFLVPAAPWVGVAGILLLLVRPLGSGFLSGRHIRVIERLTARCLVPALSWAFLGGVWCLALRFASGPLVQVSATAASTAGAAGLFVWLRDWLSKPVQDTRGSQLLDRVMGALRPVLPQVLAYAVALGMLVLVAVGLVHLAHTPDLEGIAPLRDSRAIYALLGAVTLVLGARVVLDPRRIGVHEFYRSRIGATFLRGWVEDGQRVEDDVLLGELAKSDRYRRPLHLVCTTGNDLAGDPLPNLYRGGRSVALSPLGISAGSHAGCVPTDELRLSSALTASAAAFNSQMGSMSMQFGPAVAFIMSALGLRLGLWVEHPLAARRRLLRGDYLFKEMFGWSKIDVGKTASDAEPMHLSDGGHFENLAIYELVRRHCRFIIVSDCGADPEVAFDDLANATRRIREDFGAEIELDVEPLRPNEAGLSRQHAVMGTIHYDGVSGKDKGLILYFKPTLVGDEPTDVTQYRTRNPNFPHEGTSDQFYDEAQWESYRRLGLHCGSAVFRFVEDGLHRDSNAVERLFLRAQQRWQHLRDVDQERLDALIERREQLLAEIRSSAPVAFQAELFADAASALRASPLRVSNTADALTTFQFCAEIAGLLNRVYSAAQLETHWVHPSNDVWMAFFNRCASAPSFRRWWPLLRPLCDDAVRDFVRVRFGIRVGDPSARPVADARQAAATLSLHEDNTEIPNFARDLWVMRNGAPTRPKCFKYVATLEQWEGEREPHQLVVGMLFYDEARRPRHGDTCVQWSSAELFVPPQLMGSGFSSRLLDAVICHFTERAAREQTNFTLNVTVDDEPPVPGLALGIGPPLSGPPVHKRGRLDPAHRRAREGSLHFYKSRGFFQPPGAEDEPLELCLKAIPVIKPVTAVLAPPSIRGVG